MSYGGYEKIESGDWVHYTCECGKQCEDTYWSAANSGRRCINCYITFLNKKWSKSNTDIEVPE